MKRISIAMVVVMALFLSSCDMIGLLMNQSLNDESSGVVVDEPKIGAIVVESDSFVLAWNDDNTEPAASYTVFYRSHGTEAWNKLTDIVPADGFQIEVDESLLPRGEWDFGVTSSFNSGDSSAMHTSLEAEAIPSSGWYLVWI